LLHTNLSIRNSDVPIVISVRAVTVIQDVYVIVISSIVILISLSNYIPIVVPVSAFLQNTPYKTHELTPK